MSQEGDRRGGGHTVVMRIMLDRPPDAGALAAIGRAIRGSDSVATSPGLEIEVVLKHTTADAVFTNVLPRVQEQLAGRHIRLVNIDGEDVLVEDA